MAVSVAVILPAAGSSTRYTESGGLRSKLDEDLGGKTLLQRTVEVFTKFDNPEFLLAPLLVAGPHAEADFADFRDRYADRLGLLGARLVRGGRTHRWETVAAALAAVDAIEPHAPPDLILIHDAARPCVTHEVVERVLRAARRFAAAIPGVDAGDTLKRTLTAEVSPEVDPAAAILGIGPSGPVPQRFVESTISRERVVMVQTPQVFDTLLLREAYAALSAGTLPGTITDDAQVVEAFGTLHADRLAALRASHPGRPIQGWTGRVAVVPGDSANLKVTRHEDLRIARSILGVKEPEGRAVHKRF